MSASHFRLLYVGNNDTARSPLAAACTQRIVGESNGEVAWSIGSAGIEAASGQEIPPGVRRAAEVLDLELDGYWPSPLTGEGCLTSDLILAMSWEQASHIWSMVPEAYEKVFTIKEFLHWAKRAPARPPILFADKMDHMRDKVVQAHAVRKRARADHGFWGGVQPEDLDLIDPAGKGDEAWEALARAVDALTRDVILLLAGTDEAPVSKKAKDGRSKSRQRTKAGS